MRWGVFFRAIVALGLTVPNIELAAEQSKYKVFPPDREQRILAERKGEQWLFLRGSHYALFNGRFVELSGSVSEKTGDGWRPPNLKEAAVTPAPIQNPAIAQVPPCQVKRVFLDPGHGGSDLGAALGGVFEKNISLSFAQKAQRELQALGYEAILSRSRDVFIPLDIRPELAKEWRADIFISIHMNSSPSKQVHGTETYILSAEATDADARKLALKENSILKKVPGKNAANPLSDILWDMEQTVYLQESAYLASHVQQAISEAARQMVGEKKLTGAWKNRGVRQAPFFVLSRAAMPAILLEIGYLSNAGDRRYLLSKAFQEKLAKSIADGVKIYADTCKARR